MYSNSSPSRPLEADRFAKAGHTDSPEMDPRERIAAWKRWEMTAFTEGIPARVHQTVASGAAAEPVETVARMNQAELDRLRLAAQTAGGEAGYQQGYQKGHEEGHEEGYEVGHAQGQTEGHAAAMAAVHEQARQLQALALSLPAALRLAESSVADDLLALAMDLARQVLGQVLSVEPLAMLAVVHELLRAEPALVGTPQLFLHPDDAALVNQHLSKDLQDAGWRIRQDADLQRGGCRVMASSGERDASLQTRWSRIAATLGQHTPVVTGTAL